MEKFARRLSAAALATGIAALCPGRASAEGNLGLVATRSPEAQVGWLPPRYIDSAKPVQFVLDSTRRHLRVTADPKSRLVLGLTCPDPELKWDTTAGTKPVDGGPKGSLNDRREGVSEVVVEAPRREGDARGGKVLCNDTKNPGDRKARAELTFEVASERTGLPTLPLVPLPSGPSGEFGEPEELPRGNLELGMRFPGLGGQAGLSFETLDGVGRFDLAVGGRVAAERIDQTLVDGMNEATRGTNLRAGVGGELRAKAVKWLQVALGLDAGVCHTPAVTSASGARAAAETEACLTGTLAAEVGGDFGLRVGTDATFTGDKNRVWQFFAGLYSRFGAKK